MNIRMKKMIQEIAEIENRDEQWVSDLVRTSMTYLPDDVRNLWDESEKDKFHAYVKSMMSLADEIGRMKI